MNHKLRPKAPQEGVRVNDLFINMNQNKADFDSIYIQDDPREYFSSLGVLDYMIPDMAAPVVRQIMAARSARRPADGEPTLLDVGCSYGINAALARFPLSFRDLQRRYSRREVTALTSDELAALDRRYFEGWPRRTGSRMVGLDISAPAIAYARRVGLIDAGVAADLEARALEPDEAAILSRADVILSTGAIGYVTEQTFDRLLDAASARSPWVVSFVLRMFPFDRLEAAFARRGLVTEKLTGATFVQRRFRDAEEFERTLAGLSALNLDVTGLEADGLLHAELFVSRPEADARAAPLDELVTVSSGHDAGPRYVLIDTDHGAQVGVES